MNLFITGGTGFLGNQLVQELSLIYHRIYILSRKSETQRFLHLVNVEIVVGDITNLEVVSLEGDRRENFLETIDVMIHAAALYNFQANYSEMFLQNVVGTQNVLHLLSRMKNVKSFYYISTIAVGDPQTFFLEEDSLPARTFFSDPYSETKYLAEQLVRKGDYKNIAIRIIRPGVIVGNSIDGKTEKKDGPYFFIEAFKKYRHVLKNIPILPLSYNPRAKLPIIPIDHCAHYIALLLERDTFETKMKTYHLMSLDSPNLKEFLEDLNTFIGIKTRYFPVQKNLGHDYFFKILGIPKANIPFMFSHLSFDKTNTLEDLPEIAKSSYDLYKHVLFDDK